MTKIEKIINSGFNSDEFVTFEKTRLPELIKEYAEIYARRILEAAAEELSKQFPDYSMFKHPLNIKLPEHE